MSSPSSAARLLRLPLPCPHLAAYRSGGGTPLRSLHRCLRPCPPGRTELRRDAGEIPRCASCPPGAAGRSSRLYACLVCASVSCRAHAPNHAALRPGHEIGLDVDRAELFCAVCCDQVYDPDFDAAVVIAHTSLSSSRHPPPPAEKRTKRRRVEYRPWSPDPKEGAAIGRKSSPLLVQESNASSASSTTTTTSSPSSPSPLPWGLRGLNNLGNTCFMNSVLQALLHTPLLRNYFLSDRHNRFVCQQKRKSQEKSNASKQKNAAKQKNPADGSQPCLACDLDAMFSAVFSGDRKPFSPAKFLYSWWQHASNLASYEQQDAHEFFISVLDGIHEKEKDQSKPHSHVGNGDCCIAHKAFSGILRSDVTCTVCGFTSTTYDPCVDISLDLDSNRDAMKMVTSKLQGCKSETELMLRSRNYGISTLMGCLEHFTRPEKLGADQTFFCENCQERQESLKQMSIRKIPLVTCFHIKRFEHSLTRNASRKVDRHLYFPFSLDMAPYLSSSILRARYGNRIVAFDGDDSDTGTELSSEFELFAVLTHSGNLEAGHYVTYLRLNNQWYKCDDAWVTHVNESVVRTSQAYMLFYVQKILHYKASEDVVAS